MRPNDPGRIAAMLGLDEELVRQLQARGRLLDPHLSEQLVRERLFSAHRAWATRGLRESPKRPSRWRRTSADAEDGAGQSSEYERLVGASRSDGASRSTTGTSGPIGASHVSGG